MAEVDLLEDFTDSESSDEASNEVSDEASNEESEHEMTGKAQSDAPQKSNNPRPQIAVYPRHKSIHSKLAPSETTVVILNPAWEEKDLHQALENQGFTADYLHANPPHELDQDVSRVIDFNFHPKASGAEGNSWVIPLTEPLSIAKSKGHTSEMLRRPKRFYAATYANPQHREQYRSNQLLLVAENEKHAHALLNERHPGKPMTVHEIPTANPGVFPLATLLQQ